MKTKHGYFCYFFGFPKIPICWFSLSFFFLSTLVSFVFLYFTVPQFYALLKAFSLTFLCTSAALITKIIPLLPLKEFKSKHFSTMMYIICFYFLELNTQEKYNYVLYPQFHNRFKDRSNKDFGSSFPLNI